MAVALQKSSGLPGRLGSFRGQAGRLGGFFMSTPTTAIAVACCLRTGKLMFERGPGAENELVPIASNRFVMANVSSTVDHIVRRETKPSVSNDVDFRPVKTQTLWYWCMQDRSQKVIANSGCARFIELCPDSRSSAASSSITTVKVLSFVDGISSWSGVRNFASPRWARAFLSAKTS